jgi:hypothetical protein
MGRPLIAALTALGATAGTAAAQQPVAPEPQPTPQSVFREAVLADAGTTASIKQLIRTGGGIVAPRPGFADLTTDGKSDAVVTVDSAGAAGAVAVYVLSSDGSSTGRLRVVYRNQALYRLRTRLTGTTLTLVVPRWRRGEDLCCPSTLVERDYAWSARRRTLVPRAIRTVPGPGAAPATAQPAPTR